MFRRIMAVLLLSVGLAGCLRGLSPLEPLEPLPPGGVRILFIGNSLTYYNNLAGTLSELALLTGDTIRAGAVAYPDYALVDHLRQGNALQAIRSDTWNYVVLQQGPSSVQVNRDSLIDMTRVFDDAIRKVGAGTALFSVWPQTVNYGTFPRAIESYRLAAEAVSGMYLPVGAAWQTALAEDSSLPLYSADGLHPSPLGTYLAALVMYERFTRKDARLLPTSATVNGQPVGGVTAAKIKRLQEIAHAENQRAVAEIRARQQSILPGR